METDDNDIEQKPQGNWVPISKALLCELPLNRPYTRLEAMFSLTVDNDQGNTVTVSGYSALWGWHRGKVDRFLKSVGVEIIYPENTHAKQNQNGQITSRYRADNGQINFINSKWLRSATDRKRTDNEQITDTTINPNPKPKKKPKTIKAISDNFTLPEWVPLDAWNGFAEMRLKKNEPMTDRAAKLIISKLEKFKAEGQDPGDVLNKSTVSNWIDVYPLKDSQSAQQPTEPTKRGLAI